MKILKYILYLLIALLVLFLLMGVLMPTVNYGAEVTVDKPVKEAWAVMQDESKHADWLEGFKSIELIEGEKGAVGSKYKVIVNPGEGQEDFEMIETVKSLKEFEEVELVFDSDMMDFYQKTSMSENDGKTTITSDSNVKAKGIMMRSMFALMETLGASFTKQETKNFVALKKLIEENTTNYYPSEVEAATQGVEAAPPVLEDNTK